MLADGVFEWTITDEYIYGFDGYESEHAVGFIYDRKTKQGENFNHDEFVSECKRLGLEYPSRFDTVSFEIFNVSNWINDEGWEL